MKLIRMNNDHRYYTSQDYEKLWGLVQETPVICIVDSYGDCRDIACSLWVKEEKFKPTINIGVRGMSYLYARSKPDFIKQCESINLEYIVPNALPETEDKP